MNEWTLALFGLGGTIVGGLISLFATLISNRYNREVALKAMMKSTIAPMKYEWIQELREYVARIMPSLRDGTEISLDDRLYYLTKLELILNKKHAALAGKIMRCSRMMKDAEGKGGEEHLKATDFYNECMEDCKALAKAEWDNIQDIDA